MIQNILNCVEIFYINVKYSRHLLHASPMILSLLFNRKKKNNIGYESITIKKIERKLFKRLITIFVLFYRGLDFFSFFQSIFAFETISCTRLTPSYKLVMHSNGFSVGCE